MAQVGPVVEDSELDPGTVGVLRRLVVERPDEVAEYSFDDIPEKYRERGAPWPLRDSVEEFFRPGRSYFLLRRREDGSEFVSDWDSFWLGTPAVWVDEQAKERKENDTSE
jgi:hypothetical protein